MKTPAIIVRMKLEVCKLAQMAMFAAEVAVAAVEIAMLDTHYRKTAQLAMLCQIQQASGWSDVCLKREEGATWFSNLHIWLNPRF